MHRVIFINCDKVDYIGMIARRQKVHETRKKRMLQRFIGAGTVYLARTGHHKRPRIELACQITDSVMLYGQSEFDSARSLHRVPPQDRERSTVEHKIYLYELERVRPVEPFYLPDTAIRHGRTWAEF